MKPFAIGLCLSLCFSAGAQEEVQPPPAPQSAWSSVGPGQAASLEALEAGKGPEALDLNLSLRQLKEEPQAAAALKKWVNAGGVVLLHTDAAQLFGLGTQPLRPRSRELAGQQFGRAVSALPFGAHPLLWAATSQSLDGASSGLMGVRTVFYQMRFADRETQFEGDALVNDLGEGVPILRVTDVAPNPRPLYAVVAVAYGRGLALFSPHLVEARADGAQFLANLRAFVAGVASGEWILLPSEPLQAAFSQAASEQKPDYESLVAALRGRLQPVKPTSAKTTPAKKTAEASALAGLWLEREEAQTLSRLWQEAQEGGEQSARRGAGLVLELAARAALQEPNDGGPPRPNPAIAPLFAPDTSRRKWLFETQKGGPHQNATRWWCGVFALIAAIPPLSTVPGRSRSDAF